MAKFLNTSLLNEWIPRLIDETVGELIIIVPYIKTSTRIYKHLFEANKRGVETTIVYRENKLSPEEKKKFEALDNLNLMHHPNVHAKCYYNEKYMIIGSMNLYEYSEKNNREMGVLLHRDYLSDDVSQNWNSVVDGKELFEEAIADIQTIIKASTFDQQSRETKTQGFEISIIKSQKELIHEECKKLNQVFMHKKFLPVEVRGEWKCFCENYYDHINVILDYRAVISFDYPDNRIEEIFRRVMPLYHEFRFDGFKFYWNNAKSSIYLYANSRHDIWKNAKVDEVIMLMKNGIDQVIIFLKPYL